MAVSRKTILSRLIDAAAQPVYALDDRQRIVYCNAAVADKLQSTVEDLTGMQCHWTTDPPQAENLQSRVNCLCPAPAAFRGELGQGRVPLVDSGGTDWQADFVPLQESGQVHAVLAFLRPVTSEPPAPRYRDEIRRLRSRLGVRFDIEQLIGESPGIQKAHRQARMATQTDENVLILGELGSGREHLANTIHYGGTDEPAPLVSLACQFLDDELLRTTVTSLVSQTSASNRLPTLLLTDADKLVDEAQQELWRLLSESRPFRLMATAVSWDHWTAQLLPELAEATSTVTIWLPALADRPEDVLLLAEHFRIDASSGRVPAYTASARELLVTYRWPGNIAELKQVVEMACATAGSRAIEPNDLPRHLRHAIDAALHPPQKELTIELETLLEKIESELIRRALRQADSNKAQAARLLGINRPKLLRRIEQLDIRDW